MLNFLETPVKHTLYKRQNLGTVKKLQDIANHVKFNKTYSHLLRSMSKVSQRLDTVQNLYSGM